MDYRYQHGVSRDEVGGQFEWNTEQQRWLFRRGGRGAPVEVTEEEMERTTVIQQRGTFVLYVVLFVGLQIGPTLLGISYDPSDAGSDKLDLLIALAAVALLGAGQFLINRFATWRFNGRALLGSPRTRLEVRRIRVRQMSGYELYPAFLLGLFVAGIVLRPTEPVEWFVLTIVGFLIVSTSFNLAFKWRASRS